jgi:hypothetical protein
VVDSTDAELRRNIEQLSEFTVAYRTAMKTVFLNGVTESRAVGR